MVICAVMIIRKSMSVLHLGNLIRGGGHSTYFSHNMMFHCYFSLTVYV